MQILGSMIPLGYTASTVVFLDVFLNMLNVFFLMSVIEDRHELRGQISFAY